MNQALQPARLFGDHFLCQLNDEERATVERVRRLTKDVLGPMAAEVAQTDSFAWDTFRRLAREGIVGTAFPRQYGGTDARQALRIRIIEELGRVCSTSASLITGTDLSSRAIVAGASEAMKTDRSCSARPTTTNQSDVVPRVMNFLRPLTT